jgi:uncharacterized protein YodC (DUF2158 family)
MADAVVRLVFSAKKRRREMFMEGKFKPGDVVRLKSGGPSMTVDFWDDTMSAYCCTWFVLTLRKQDHFQEATLEKVV